MKLTIHNWGYFDLQQPLFGRQKHPDSDHPPGPSHSMNVTGLLVPISAWRERPILMPMKIAHEEPGSIVISCDLVLIYQSRMLHVWNTYLHSPQTWLKFSVSIPAPWSIWKWMANFDFKEHNHWIHTKPLWTISAEAQPRPWGMQNRRPVKEIPGAKCHFDHPHTTPYGSTV